jgi:hypothetical protein
VYKRQASDTTVTAATQANPCVITANKAHNLVNGDKIILQNIAGMTELNDASYDVTVIDSTNFSIGVNSSAYTAYSSGGDVRTAGVWYDSPRSLDIKNGYWEGNDIDLFFPTPTNSATIRPALLGFNVDEQSLTILNQAGRSIIETQLGVGGNNSGDMLSSIAMEIKTGTDIEVKIFDSLNAGDPSSYNSRLNHAFTAVAKGGSATVSTTEGIITYELNAGGTELVITLPEGDLNRVLFAQTVLDNSGLANLVWRTDLTTATLANNKIRLEPYNSAVAVDMNTMAYVQLVLVMIRLRN